MQPFKGGGDMILSVTFEKTTYTVGPSPGRGRPLRGVRAAGDAPSTRRMRNHSVTRNSTVAFAPFGPCIR